MTALHRFLILRKEKNIKLILEKGASVIPATKCGNTALHLAAMRNNTSILDMLLNYDADTNSVTDMHPSLKG
jgi:ankyrin repeat protein